MAIGLFLKTVSHPGNVAQSECTVRVQHKIPNLAQVRKLSLNAHRVGPIPVVYAAQVLTSPIIVVQAPPNLSGRKTMRLQQQRIQDDFHGAAPPAHYGHIHNTVDRLQFRTDFFLRELP